MIDVTNPGAADYLRQTYTKLVHEWGIHYIKLDFMDDSAIEGYFHQPNTTAMEAQRIGLGIIRKAVGDDVYLDKDGSVMLNPVGYVDYGRVSQDTGHTFEATREAEPGIAARYYMNRNYFVADPDAFAVSTQTIADQSWHESHKPATLDESRAAIALAAVTAGMFEIGDNLPTLEHEPDRLALIENQDLIDMIQLGRSATPIDLMDYREQDQPADHLLPERIAAAKHSHRLQLDEAASRPHDPIAATGPFQHRPILSFRRAREERSARTLRRRGSADDPAPVRAHGEVHR